MFTGIVEELGTIRAAERAAADADHELSLTIAAETVLDDVELGASIAVNGCCLTVTEHGDGWWRTELSGETVRRTTLGDLAPGDRVNLERPMTLGGRLGGHVVLGHVDGIGEVVEAAPRLRVRLPAGLGRYVVEKGSIAIDGISLTAFGIEPDGDDGDGADDGGADTIEVAVIPHTAAVTTLGHRPAGSRVNVEVDILAKHVERLLAGITS